MNAARWSAAVVWLALSAGTSTVSTAGGGPLSAAERDFIHEAAGTGLYEAEGAQMAAAKGTQPALRAFGTMLIMSHRATHDALQRLARANGVALPIHVAAEQRSKLDRLAQLSGATFEREFVQTVGIADPEATIERFNAAARDVRDPALQAWIGATLPALQRHLQQARELPLPPLG